MGTPSVTYVEDFGLAVRVNYDGYPEHMIPALHRIIELGLVEEFAHGIEYSSINSNDADYQGCLARSTDRYKETLVGSEYTSDKIEITAFKDGNGNYFFDQEEDYAYLIKDGKVFILVENTIEGETFFTVE